MIMMKLKTYINDSSYDWSPHIHWVANLHGAGVIAGWEDDREQIRDLKHNQDGIQQELANIERTEWNWPTKSRGFTAAAAVAPIHFRRRHYEKNGCRNPHENSLLEAWRKIRV